MKRYKRYQGITKSILDTIRVGDLVKVNNWKKPMKVAGVSDNYFVMTQSVFGKLYYSVCEKKEWGGIRYNMMIGGRFHVGTDNSIFGWLGTLEMIEAGRTFSYKFKDDDLIIEYLDAFEREELELSVRTSIPIYLLQVKCS